MADNIVTSKESEFHELNSSTIEGDIHVAGITSDEEEQSTLDEPITQTLKRDLAAIVSKFLHVIVPRQKKSLLRDWDLWGPLILCILLATLLQGSESDGAPQFAQVFAVVWVGSGVVTVNSKLLGGTIEITFASQERRITIVNKKAYNLYFSCKIGDHDKSWALHIKLFMWIETFLMVEWESAFCSVNEPRDHVSNCYFCMVVLIVKSFTKEKNAVFSLAKHSIVIFLIPYDELSILEAPEPFVNKSSKEDFWEASSDELKALLDPFTGLHLIIQMGFNDLIKGASPPNNEAKV